jgi:hypothetical protein
MNCEIAALDSLACFKARIVSFPLLPMRLKPGRKRKSLDTGLAGEVDRAPIGVEVRTSGEIFVKAVSEIDWLAPMVPFAEGNTHAAQSSFHLAGIERNERLIGCHCRIMN